MNRFSRLTLLLGAILALTAPLCAQSCGSMDVVIVQDVTGGMRVAIDNIRAGLPAVVQAAEAASGGDLRMGLISFRDNVEVHHDLSANAAAVQATFSSSSFIAAGGSNPPEAWDEALRTVVDLRSEAQQPCRGSSGDFTVPFRPGAVKLMILITDALPAGCDDHFDRGEDDVRAHQVALDAAAQGIRIAAIQVGNDIDVRFTLQDLAHTTGGTFAQVGWDGSEAAQALTETLSHCGQPCMTITTEYLTCTGKNGIFQVFGDLYVNKLPNPDSPVYGIELTSLTPGTAVDPPSAQVSPPRYEGDTKSGKILISGPEGKEVTIRVTIKDRFGGDICFVDHVVKLPTCTPDLKLDIGDSDAGATLDSGEEFPLAYVHGATPNGLLTLGSGPDSGSSAPGWKGGTPGGAVAYGKVGSTSNNNLSVLGHKHADSEGTVFFYPSELIRQPLFERIKGLGQGRTLKFWVYDHQADELVEQAIFMRFR